MEIQCPHCQHIGSDHIIQKDEHFIHARCSQCKNLFTLPFSEDVFCHKTPSEEAKEAFVNDSLQAQCSADGIQAKQNKGSVPPFEQSSKKTFIKNALLTIKQVLFSPKVFFTSLEHGNGQVKPLLFALLMSYVAIFIGQITNSIAFFTFKDTILSSLPYADFPGWAQGIIDNLFLIGVALFILKIVSTLVNVPLMLYTFAAITHLCLLIVRGPYAGFTATLRVFCYAQAAAVFSWIPTVGWLINITWQSYTIGAGLAYIHRTSFTRIGLALLLPLLVLCIIGVMLIPLAAFVMEKFTTLRIEEFINTFLLNTM